MEWIISSLTDLMGTYWWITVGTVIGTVAILLGLAAPIALRLEDARAALVFHAVHPSWSARGITSPSSPFPGCAAAIAVRSRCGPSRTSGRS
jgi:hypothetical protein